MKFNAVCGYFFDYLVRASSNGLFDVPRFFLGNACVDISFLGKHLPLTIFSSVYSYFKLFLFLE